MFSILGDVELRFRNEKEPYLQNVIYDTTPLVVHGNGPTNMALNNLGNYLAQAWNTEDQCTACWEDNLVFKEMPEVPQVVMAIFIEKPTPFLEEFFGKIANLNYPKDKIDLFIHNTLEYHMEDVSDFITFVNEGLKKKKEVIFFIQIVIID